MKKIILSGCNGAMGRVIQSIVGSRSDCEIVAGFDPNGSGEPTFPVFATPTQYHSPADVIIDFSHPSALNCLLDYAVNYRVPAVIATTGLSEEQTQLVLETGKLIPVFFCANMSLGVNLLLDLAEKATKVLGDSFDIEIIEKHHNQKLDAPSGTAMMLAKRIDTALGTSPKYEYDRHSQRKKRDKNEIGMHAVRGGTIVGEHEVLFAGRDELFSIRHTALSKEIFAAGAVNAALFLSQQQAGVYTMKDLIAAQ